MNLTARNLNDNVGTVFVDTSVVFGRGATATVYAARLLGEPYAAKIYHAEHPFPSAKISAMLENPPFEIDSSHLTTFKTKFAWPICILTNTQGDDVGFLMPALNLKRAYPLDYFYDNNLIKKLKDKSEKSLSFKIEIARNLSSLVAELHAHNHHFIDMKPQNIRVEIGTHDVTLLDCDGFSVLGANGTRHPAQLMSTDYIAPEAFLSNASPATLGEFQDKYALAVILFQLLNRGTHPFQGIVKFKNPVYATNDEKAAQKLYPHGRNPNSRIAPRPQSIHFLFDDGLQALFEQAFTGQYYERPSAADWKSRFEQIIKDKGLARCVHFPQDIEHIRFAGKECPACYINNLDIPQTPATKVSSPPKAQTHKFSRPAPAGGTSYPPSYPPHPATNVNSSTWLFILSVIAFVVLLFIFMGSYSRKFNYPSNQTNEQNQTPACSISNRTTSDLCYQYWNNIFPTCDESVKNELTRRGVALQSLSCYEQKKTGAAPAANTSTTKTQTVFEKLAANNSKTQALYSWNSVDQNLWAQAVDKILKEMEDRIKKEQVTAIQEENAILLHQISIRPFSSFVLVAGKNKCSIVGDPIGQCIQVPAGLKCEIESKNTDFTDTCIYSLRR